MTEQRRNNEINDEIDLRDLLSALRSGIRVIVVGTLASLAVAATYAYGIAKPDYTSMALLLPTESGSSTPDLGSAALFLGAKKSGSADVDLYQSLLTSRTVIHKLLRTHMLDLSDTGKGRKVPLSELLGLDTTDPIMVERAVTGLSNAITVDSKASGAGGILEVKVVTRAPWLSQQVCNTVLDIGQEELRLVRIERSEVTVSRLAVAVQLARGEWDSAASVLAWYKDRNRSITLPEQMLDLSRLEIEKSAKEQKYLLARKELEGQLLEKAKAAPPMMILDPADLPAYKSGPRRSLIMALALLLGLTGSSVFVVLRKAFQPDPTNGV
jgi:uncharacterized protein involved in exopolysaccharide biosynthesis